MSIGVFRGIANGVEQRGDGGFLFVRGDHCAYMFLHELGNLEAAQREHLEELLHGEAARKVFYVLEEKDANLHVLAYPKEVVFQQLADDARGGAETGPGGAHDTADPLPPTGSDPAAPHP